MPRDQFPKFRSREKRQFRRRYPGVDHRKYSVAPPHSSNQPPNLYRSATGSKDAVAQAIARRWKQMNTTDRTNYFNGTWYYPGQPWRDPVCQKCRNENLLCDFDAENSMCRQCRDPDRQDDPPSRCLRLCDHHRNGASPPVNCGSCQNIQRRVCGICKFATPPTTCTFEGDGPCQQCRQRYLEGRIDRGACRELCGSCAALVRPPGACAQCHKHIIYQAPGKFSSFNSDRSLTVNQTT